MTWHVAMRRAKRRALPKNKLGAYLFSLFGFANLLLTGRCFTISETRHSSYTKLEMPCFAKKCNSENLETNLNCIKCGATAPVATRASDGASVYQETVNDVKVEVIKVSNEFS